MNIVIIGSNGIVGRSLVDHFMSSNHSVIEVDLDSDSTIEEASRRADVVFVAILPLKDVPDVMMSVVKNIGHGKMIVNCSSIQQIDGMQNIPEGLLIQKGITVCHLHFHFTPMIPLERSLFGKNITVFFLGSVHQTLVKWLKDQFVPHGVFWHDLTESEHDRLTKVSQLPHMLNALMMGAVWDQGDQKLIEKALRIGGPPHWFLMLSTLRASRSPKVIAEILCEHPHSLDVISALRTALSEIEACVNERDMHKLSEMASRSRSLLNADFLEITDKTTEALLDHEAARRVRNTIILRFSHEQDITSLRNEIVQVFKDHDVSLTAILPEKSAFNGMIFRVSFEEFDLKAEAAVSVIRKTWSLPS